MTKFADPARRRLADGRVVWEGGSVPLPSVLLRPQEAGWSLRLEVGDRWLATQVGWDELTAFLLLWEQSPEQALADYFVVEVPKGDPKRETFGQGETWVGQGYVKATKSPPPSAPIDASDLEVDF